MKMITKCTLWSRKYGGFNHIEDGHQTAATPTPKHPAQAGWARTEWTREHAWLVNTKPARILRRHHAAYAAVAACLLCFVFGWGLV